jgi:hypothetical protein
MVKKLEHLGHRPLDPRAWSGACIGWWQNTQRVTKAMTLSQRAGTGYVVLPLPFLLEGEVGGRASA